jgi:hypothetical protein
MDIGKAFTDAWNTYTRNFIIIFLATIVSSILGFLIAPLVGFQMMFVKAKRETALTFNDVFAPFSHFIALIWVVILMAIILVAIYLPSVICFSLNWNFLGTILMLAAIFITIYLGVCWMFALLFVADKELKGMSALNASRDLVIKNNWWLHFMLAILAGIVGSLGQFLFGFGVILTIPLGTGAIASAYANETK